MIRLFRSRKPACRCRPQWPALVTEMNGYLMPCLPSEHGSPFTTMMELSARCAECSAAYPGNFVIDPDTPPPFDWAHEPENTVCSCEPRWPKLMVKLRGQWFLGHPGTDGGSTAKPAMRRGRWRATERRPRPWA